MKDITKAFKDMDRKDLELFAQTLFYCNAYYHKLLFDKYNEKGKE